LQPGLCTRFFFEFFTLHCGAAREELFRRKNQGAKMQRVAFLAHVKPGKEAEYDRWHAAVWPEMLSLLSASGISDYSIFRRDQLLVLTFTIHEDFNTVWDRVEASPINTKWQAEMANICQPPTGMRGTERFPMMQEVFYMA